MKTQIGASILLAVMSGGVLADWIKAHTFVNGTTVYFDPTTIRKTGNAAQIWELTDYPKPRIYKGQQT